MNDSRQKQDPMQWDWTRAIFDHVHLRVEDLERSMAFYSAVLEPLAIPLHLDDGTTAQWANVAVSNDGPVTRNLHMAFMAASREQVEAFHRAGVEAGFADNGAPGERPQYGPPQMTYFAAYLLDPDGNNVEAVCRAPAA